MRVVPRASCGLAGLATVGRPRRSAPLCRPWQAVATVDVRSAPSLQGAPRRVPSSSCRQASGVGGTLRVSHRLRFGAIPRTRSTPLVIARVGVMMPA